MTRDETMHTRWGEFMDMLACMAIYNGGAREKKKEKSFIEIMEMR